MAGRSGELEDGQGSHPAVFRSRWQQPRASCRGGSIPSAPNSREPIASPYVCLPGCYLLSLSLSSGFIDTLSVLAGHQCF